MNSEQNVKDMPSVPVCTSNYCSRRVRPKDSFGDATQAEKFTIAGDIILRQAQDYFNFFNASPSLEIISGISSFLQVPTLSLYHAESRLAPNA